MTSRIGRALSLVLALLSLACAGGRGVVRFDSLGYPASMSGYVYGSNGLPLSPNTLKVVGEFEREAKLWGMLFSWIPLTGRLDLSTPINQEIERAGGDGVINLTVRSQGCTLNYVPGLSLLPVWPGCAAVTVQGQIVKHQPARQRRRAASSRR